MKDNSALRKLENNTNTPCAFINTKEINATRRLNARMVVRNFGRRTTLSTITFLDVIVLSDTISPEIVKKYKKLGVKIWLVIIR